MVGNDVGQVMAEAPCDVHELVFVAGGDGVLEGDARYLAERTEADGGRNLRLVQDVLAEIGAISIGIAQANVEMLDAASAKTVQVVFHQRIILAAIQICRETSWPRDEQIAS